MLTFEKVPGEDFAVWLLGAARVDPRIRENIELRSDQEWRRNFDCYLSETGLSGFAINNTDSELSALFSRER